MGTRRRQSMMAAWLAAATKNCAGAAWVATHAKGIREAIALALRDKDHELA
jgi:hypothetical protein